MPTGYIPRADGTFDTWQHHFGIYVTAHFLELGLTVEEVTGLKKVMLPWRSAFEAHGAARAAAKAARIAKTDRRGDYERTIREVVRRIQSNEAVTDAQRAALGITVRDAEPTPAPAPTPRSGQNNPPSAGGLWSRSISPSVCGTRCATPTSPRPPAAPGPAAPSARRSG